MYTKLTLNIDDAVIASAKAVAKERHLSLSKIVENFLISLSTGYDIVPEKDNLSNEVAELKGAYKTAAVVDEKEILKNALKKKYL